MELNPLDRSFYPFQVQSIFIHLSKYLIIQAYNLTNNTLSLVIAINSRKTKYLRTWTLAPFSPHFSKKNPPSRSISAIPSRSDITVIITSRTIVQLSQCRSFIDDPSSNASKIRINNLYTDALCCAGCAQFRSNNNRIGRVGGFIRARLCMQIGKRLSNHDPHEARVSVTEFREVIKWRVKRGEIRSGIGVYALWMPCT